MDGTTDITRTLHFGKPTKHERDCYTRVLLGNFNIERMQWKEHSGLTGSDIDMLARAQLSFAGLENYAHATGHGVGHYSGVHEFPPGLDRYFT